MIARPKVLVVEDDLAVRLLLQSALLSWHYTVIEVEDGAAAMPTIASERPALVVLDIGLPGKSGLEIVEEMRAAGHQQPVLFITTCDEIEIRVRALLSGADDFITKPFNVKELGARIRAILRRSGRSRRLLQLGESLVDLDEKKAERGGQSLALTSREYRLIEELAKAGGQPVSRQQLLQSVWGYNENVRTRTLETQLWRLRKKLGGESDGAPIRNVPDVGYLLAETAGLTGDEAGGFRRPSD